MRKVLTTANIELTRRCNLNCEFCAKGTAQNIDTTKEVDLSNDFDWINKNVPMNELLDVELNETFRCVIHDDNNPSAWVTTSNKEYQLYMCHSCGNNITLIDLLGKMFSNVSKTIKIIP